jgi:hypothetical protein
MRRTGAARHITFGKAGNGDAAPPPPDGPVIGGIPILFAFTVMRAFPLYRPAIL